MQSLAVLVAESLRNGLFTWPWRAGMSVYHFLGRHTSADVSVASPLTLESRELRIVYPVEGVSS